MLSKKIKILLFSIILHLVIFNFATAQEDTHLSIEINKPREGETLYAGPETLMYSINIEGRVSGMEDPTTVEVLLEIIQNNNVIESSMTYPDDKGLFLFPATVNPEGSIGNFTAVEIEAGCENCHYRASLDLPSRSMLIKVTAEASDGQEATVERQITVDLSGYTTIPILVTLADSPETAVSGITVQGSARLYEWRARHPSAQTDENGLAYMRVEALSEIPTRYIFKVVPTIIDGVLYQGTESSETIIPPGSFPEEQIVLQAFGELGNIHGRFFNSQMDVTKPFQVWAIHLPDGRSYRSVSDDQGRFEFSEIPYGIYLISADAWELAQENLMSVNQTVELTQSKRGSVLIPIRQIEGVTLIGNVVDEIGGPIPFAQVTLGLRRTQRTLPSNGIWTFFNLPQGTLTLTISAPGYFSQQRTISTTGLEKEDALQIELKRRPELRTLAWGDGEVLIPPETDGTSEANQIWINQGWIWGSGEGGESLSIITPSEEIHLNNGSFALEVTDTSDSWFYLWQGHAAVKSSDDDRQVEVHSGEMVSLSSPDTLIPVPMDPVVDAGYHLDSQLLISPVWEKSLVEQIKSRLASISTSIIQIITFITYAIGLLLLVVLPAWALIKWHRNR